MTDPELCEICMQNAPENGRVCEECRETIAKQLYGLLGQVHRLEADLTPSVSRSDGVRVSTSKGEAPIPVRLDPLSLLGPGNVHVSALMHPKVRHWRTSREADITFVRRSWVQKTDNGPWVSHAEVVTERRTIVEWHQELARDEYGNVIEVADDDQIGALPPREWLELMVREWREIFQHHVPRTMRQVPWPQRYLVSRGSPKNHRALMAVNAGWAVGGPPRMTTQRAALAVLAADPATASAIAAMRAIRQQYDQAIVDTIAGTSYGYGGDTARRTTTLDPLADDITARFGASTTAEAITRPVAYLLLWLDEACTRPDMPVADFAGELRSLSAELARVLGDRPDLHWLGRCPARLTDTADAGGGAAVTRPCGAGLWQDPYASQVSCPRCHSVWGPAKVHLLRLAVDIRRTWPVDRRRRYTAEERVVIRRPRCPNCGDLADVTWREVTGTDDKVRTWQPTGSTCPSGCDDAKQAI